MKVPHSEGVANDTDPLSCVGHREVSGEALAGESPQREQGAGDYIWHLFDKLEDLRPILK